MERLFEQHLSLPGAFLNTVNLPMSSINGVDIADVVVVDTGGGVADVVVVDGGGSAADVVVVDVVGGVADIVVIVLLISRHDDQFEATATLFLTFA